MAEEKTAPTANPVVSFHAILIPFVALLLLPLCVGQNAGARRDFVKRLGQSTIVTKKGSELVPVYKISADGPDSSFFVYHASLMNPSICRGMLTEGFVSKFRALGFAKLVCTDDADETFTFDPVVQNVSPAVARKDYAEMVRRSVIKQLGTRYTRGLQPFRRGTRCHLLRASPVRSEPGRLQRSARRPIHLRLAGTRVCQAGLHGRPQLDVCVRPQSEVGGCGFRPAGTAGVDYKISYSTPSVSERIVSMSAPRSLPSEPAFLYGLDDSK